jgi:hypothetical protein
MNQTEICHFRPVLTVMTGSEGAKWYGHGKRDTIIGPVCIRQSQRCSRTIYCHYRLCVVALHYILLHITYTSHCPSPDVGIGRIIVSVVNPKKNKKNKETMKASYSGPNGLSFQSWSFHEPYWLPSFYPSIPSLLSRRYYPFAIIPRVIKMKRLNALHVRGKTGGA